MRGGSPEVCRLEGGGRRGKAGIYQKGFPMNRFYRSWIGVAVFGVSVAGIVGAANAQIRDAGAKIRGEYGMSMQSTSRSLSHARDYAYDYRTYAQDAHENKRPINPAVAKATAEQLGHNIKLTEKHLADMRKHAAGDKETLASLDSIEKHLKDASKHQADMLEMCKAEVDAQGSMKCCGDAAASLDKAIAEHDKLMKKLAAKKPATK